MANDEWKDRGWLYNHYVTRRLGLKQIQAILDEKYGIKVTQQTIYNYLKKYDLLILRGKGRNLSRYGTQKRPETDMAKKAREWKRHQRLINQKKPNRKPYSP